jgi:hypothetical protein
MVNHTYSKRSAVEVINSIHAYEEAHPSQASMGCYILLPKAKLQAAPKAFADFFDALIAAFGVTLCKARLMVPGWRVELGWCTMTRIWW